MPKEATMPVQIPISGSASRGRPHRTLVKAANEGLLIRDYLNAEISLGELPSFWRWILMKLATGSTSRESTPPASSPLI